MSVKNLLCRSIASFACGAALSASSLISALTAGPAWAQASCEWDACGWAWGPAAVINNMIVGSDIGRHPVVTTSPYLHYPAYYDGLRQDEERAPKGCGRRRVGPDGRAHWRRSC
jgi:hypothetical protein